MFLLVLLLPLLSAGFSRSVSLPEEELVSHRFEADLSCLSNIYSVKKDEGDNSTIFVKFYTPVAKDLVCLAEITE
jgi:hypothetical protein